jgi:hypothetical protein
MSTYHYHVIALVGLAILFIILYATIFGVTLALIMPIQRGEFNAV